MFKSLRSDPDNLLPVSPNTIASLKALGAAMEDFTAENPAGDNTIPAAYTYLGQFIDHDITLQTPVAAIPDIDAPNFAPLADPSPLFKNLRQPWLDLDCVYASPAPTETFWNIIRFSPDSIIGPDGKVTGNPFSLAELISLSGNGN